MNKEILLKNIDLIAADYAAGSFDLKSFYNRISRECMDQLKFVGPNAGKTCHYLSMEFLMGRMIDNNLLAMGMLSEVRGILEKHGIDELCFEDIDDCALGNGGLGRLAACFLDSAATMGINLQGYGIRYKFGLFKQVFKDGAQYEEKDNWLQFGDPWSVQREEEAIEIVFADGRVNAIPYDMPIIGYKNRSINTLRLWESKAIDGDGDFGISDYLYPDDSTLSGKILRLRQQFFFSGATIRYVINQYVKLYGGDFGNFSKFNTFQLNDTHPVIAILDLIHILMKKHKKSFKYSLEIARQSFNYTNHTIMPEALETWNTSILNKILPKHLRIARRINHYLLKELRKRGITRKQCSDFSLLKDGQLHMSRLAIFVCKNVNGVAEIHTGILRKVVFSNWWKIFPEKLQNKTNGITQRRWLGLCNTELSMFIKTFIGDGFLKNLNELKNLKKHINEDFIIEFINIKNLKKEQLVAYIMKKQEIKLNSDMIFDIQIKRIHEYKRQLLNIFSTLYIYFMMKDGELNDFKPTTFIFGGKSAGGYVRAKAIIKFINNIAEIINADDEVKDRMKIFFIENYNVSYAEKLFPAADVSVQISTAGTEASGTGNMKFMLNGAVTLGTYDGANIEIVDEAGIENNYIFGARVEDIESIKESYDPNFIINDNPMIKRVVETLIDGTIEDEDGSFRELYDSITIGASWHKPDHYYLMQDLEAFIEARLKVNEDQKNEKDFALKCINNMLNAGKFSSDRTIKEYSQDIWKL